MTCRFHTFRSTWMCRMHTDFIDAHLLAFWMWRTTACENIGLFGLGCVAGTTECNIFFTSHMQCNRAVTNPATCNQIWGIAVAEEVVTPTDVFLRCRGRFRLELTKPFASISAQKSIKPWCVRWHSCNKWVAPYRKCFPRVVESKPAAACKVPLHVSRE